MDEAELEKIQNRVNDCFLKNIKNASGPTAMVLDWKDTTILSLIAEVRRLRVEKHRVASVMNLFIQEYGRFDLEEIILRGDEPRMNDMRFLREWIDL